MNQGRAVNFPCQVQAWTTPGKYSFIASALKYSSSGSAHFAAANSAMEAFDHAASAALDLASGVAEAAHTTAAQALGGGMRLDVVIFDRTGKLLARAGH